jgi:maltose alpha-D-glucosyltransferase / alpha-amylase
VPYLFEREGTNCENLVETHQYLKELRAHIDKKYPGRMVLAEANQWPEDAVAYFGKGDECHTAFHFPVMPRLFMSIQMEDRFPIIDILDQTPAIPDVCQWVVFLRNHDELTLEMVTDEERDYMYRAYARDPQARVNLGIRRRLAPLVGNDRRKIELLNGLLMSLPGTPVIYYGDEIGMGDNIYLGDRNGVRTPMQWSPDRNSGFSDANPQSLYLPVIIDHEYHYEAINVETQQRNPHSLLWWTRRLIALRRQTPVFGRGSIQFLYPDNRKALAFVRKHQDETVLVVANLSRSPQFVQLDLSEYKNSVPVEMLGRTAFPPIGALPYLLTLAPYSFYWFSLSAAGHRQKPMQFQSHAHSRREPPVVAVRGEALADLVPAAWRTLEGILPQFLESRSWFRSTERTIVSASFLDLVPLPSGGDRKLLLALAQVEFTEGESEFYVLPLGVGGPDHARSLATEDSPLVLAWVRPSGTPAEQTRVVYDAFGDREFAEGLLAAPGFPEMRGAPHEHLSKSVRGPGTYEGSIIYADRLFLRFFRRLYVGPNPEVELSSVLSHAGFKHIAPPAGAITYRKKRDEFVLAAVNGFVRNEGDAWQLAIRSVERYWEHLAAEGSARALSDDVLPSVDPLALLGRKQPQQLDGLLAPFDDSAELLGRRTAEFHLALAASPDEPTFAPVPISKQYQRSLYQGFRSYARWVLRNLQARIPDLPSRLQDLAREVAEREAEVVACYEPLMNAEIEATRIRIHTDMHLANVLFTGKDFVFVGLEGEEDRPISERRIKRSPLRDVAQMIDSLRYAAFSPWHVPVSGIVLPQWPAEQLHRWAQVWYAWTAAAYLQSYLETARGASFLATSDENIQLLLRCFLMDRALRPLAHVETLQESWVEGALEGIRQRLSAQHKSS